MWRPVNFSPQHVPVAFAASTEGLSVKLDRRITAWPEMDPCIKVARIASLEYLHISIFPVVVQHDILKLPTN